MEIPFRYDPRKQDVQVGMIHTKLKLNESTVIVCEAYCSGCEDYLGKYPISSKPEDDGYWRVRCANCGSVLYEELMVQSSLGKVKK